ncbi:hypothetical protein C8J56DRAFT_1040405 [Mycena floridula]|nr:hypothetical protein C8J56DRAFT_1040405 [Mycena floridula]
MTENLVYCYTLDNSLTVTATIQILDSIVQPIPLNPRNPLFENTTLEQEASAQVERPHWNHANAHTGPIARSMKLPVDEEVDVADRKEKEIEKRNEMLQNMGRWLKQRIRRCSPPTGLLKHHLIFSPRKVFYFRLHFVASFPHDYATTPRLSPRQLAAIILGAEISSFVLFASKGHWESSPKSQNGQETELKMAWGVALAVGTGEENVGTDKEAMEQS